MCTDCFKQNFEVLIRDKDVINWCCTICRQPDLLEENNEVVIDGHFQFLGIKVITFIFIFPKTL